MQELTLAEAKPLLKLHGRPLMEWSMQHLARDGIKHVVINTAWCGARIVNRWKNQYTCSQGQFDIAYSREELDSGHALETAGGISRALPLLPEIFWVIAGDVYAPDFVFDLAVLSAFARSEALAHLWVVANPEHHVQGDFSFVEKESYLTSQSSPEQKRYTYSTIGLYRRDLFLPPWTDLALGNPDSKVLALGPLLKKAMLAQRITGALYTGRWSDIGTPERLKAANDLHLAP